MVGVMCSIKGPIITVEVIRRNKLSLEFLHPRYHFGKFLITMPIAIFHQKQFFFSFYINIVSQEVCATGHSIVIGY